MTASGRLYDGATCGAQGVNVNWCEFDSVNRLVRGGAVR